MTRSCDRGQLILVAGLTVAVILVMLVLLLNTVIYTENLATRGIDSGAADAIEYRATVVGSVEELIERENEYYDEGHPPKEGVKAGIEVLSKTLSERYLERGVIAETTVDSAQIHTDSSSPHIWHNESNGQNEPNKFPSNEDSEWIIATEVTDVDRFVITIDSIKDWDDSDNERLRIVYDSPENDPWILEIKATEEEAVEFEVIIDDSESLPYETDSLDIDLVQGDINEDSGIINLPTDYETIGFENGDTTYGAFDLHLSGEPGDQVTRYGEEPGDGPYYTYPVEEVTNLKIHYETSELRFVTTIEQITPGEEP